MYCMSCGIDAERPWCPYCGDDMVEVEEACFMAESRFEHEPREPRPRRRRRRGNIERGED